MNIKNLEKEYDAFGVFAFSVYLKLFKLILTNPGNLSREDIYKVAYEEKWILPNGKSFDYNDIIDVLEHRVCEPPYISEKDGTYVPTQYGINMFNTFLVKKDLYVE